MLPSAVDYGRTTLCAYTEMFFLAAVAAAVDRLLTSTVDYRRNSLCAYTGIVGRHVLCACTENDIFVAAIAAAAVVVVVVVVAVVCCCC